MLLLAAAALAETSAASFATDAGDWNGGTVANGSLVLVDESATLDVGEVESFTFNARMRLAGGNSFTVELSPECILKGDYTGTGVVSFNGITTPFGVEELVPVPDPALVLSPGSSSADAGGLSDPDVASFAGAWWMVYTATSALGITQLEAATSTDLATWTRSPAVALAGASQASLTADGAELVVYYTQNGSIYRTSTSDGATFGFPTLALSPGTGFDVTGIGHPSVVRNSGGWRMYYGVPSTGATGSATSLDGITFTRESQLTSDDNRLAGLDVLDDVFGLEGVYTLLDSVGFASGGSDPLFTDASNDLLPLLSLLDTDWSDGGFGTAAMVRSGDDLTLFVDALNGGSRGIGRVATTPSPGTWGSVAVTWDGALTTATWNDGTVFTCALTTYQAIAIRADGQVEIDEATLTFDALGGDTGDTGDTAGEDSGDTAEPDTADTGVVLGYNAGESMGEPGGCGCQTARSAGTAALIGGVLSLLGALRRRSERPA